MTTITEKTGREETVASGRRQDVWASPAKDALHRLGVTAADGLKPDQVKRRLEKYGPNMLRKHARKSVWTILFDQLKSLIMGLLIAAALVSMIYQEMLEAGAIAVVIVINTAIGFFTELRAVRSMEALVELGTVRTRVRRAGRTREVDAQELVPGDIVLFEGGDVITADLRIIDGSKIQADESTLTGESMPVSKDQQPVEASAVLAERSCMLYKGTSVTRGAGTGVVVATGIHTELGQISQLVEEAEKEQTPLEHRLDQLGHRLIGLTLVIVVLVSLAGIVRGRDVLLMVETGIALAIASIPEGLPIVATIALAKGLRRMAEKNALINRLSSVETLGTAGVIFTDKTGTLTKNQMTVARLLLPDQTIESGARPTEAHIRETQVNDGQPGDPSLKRAWQTAILCNNASLDECRAGTGDPLEIALLAAAHRSGYDIDEVRKGWPEDREEAFDPDVKMMATWNRTGSGTWRVHVKGAPATILEHCRLQHMGADVEDEPLTDEMRGQWNAANERLAAEGHRLLALACKKVSTLEGNPYEQLVFIGLVALQDPPRTEVKKALSMCREAGIRVIMVTGDQAATAQSIARSVGLTQGRRSEERVIHGSDLPEPALLTEDSETREEVMQSRIFARISPRQKLDLVTMYQHQGYVVAMTGDGVNDAPALKKADIGIAMGRGTQVAKEAADMVLLDDGFATIAAAIEEGRVVFSNIRRFIFYLLSCNVSEVMIVGLATLAGAPLPLLPLQILFLNLVTDVFPALALGMGKGREGVMQQPPRAANEPILGRRQWLGIMGYGMVITAAVLGVLYIAVTHWGMKTQQAVTLSFLTLAFAQLWHVFNMRSSRSHIWNNTVVNNKWVWMALALCTALILGALYMDPVARVMDLHPPELKEWLLVMAMSLLPLAVGQWHKSRFGRARDKSTMPST